MGLLYERGAQRSLKGSVMAYGIDSTACIAKSMEGQRVE